MIRAALAAAVVLAAIAAPAGCATERPFIWVESLPPIAAKGEGRIRPRDAIVVSVRDQPTLSGEFIVRDDGGVLLPVIGDVTVIGRTADEVRAEVQQRATSVVVHPVVAVSIARVASIRVNVVGEVKTPANYELTRDRSVAAALAAAGWLTEFADRNRIFVVRSEENLRVRFRARDVTALTPAVARFHLSDGDVVVVE